MLLGAVSGPSLLEPLPLSFPSNKHYKCQQELTHVTNEEREPKSLGDLPEALEPVNELARTCAQVTEP